MCADRHDSKVSAFKAASRETARDWPALKASGRTNQFDDGNAASVNDNEHDARGNADRKLPSASATSVRR